MPSIQQRGAAFQLRVKHKLLNAPYFQTFDSYEAADEHGAELVRLLKKGFVPTEVAAVTQPKEEPGILLMEVVRSYCRLAPVTNSDYALLGVMHGEISGVRMAAVTVQWVEGYVTDLKRDQNLAPGSIRKRVGVLARVVDWHLRRTTPKGTTRPDNPLRGLPVGYSHYTKDDAALLDSDQRVKKDEKRDRRLTLSEEKTIRAVLAGGKMPGTRKGVKLEPAFLLLFELIVDTGLRLSEAYKLRVDQFEMDKGYMRVEGSKGARGAIKPRTVPLKQSLRPKLAARIEEVKAGRIFPWWDGDPATAKECSTYLSKRFEQLFAYCEIEDLTQHDLRHEATCRWVELKNAKGWVFSDVEVARLMGWSSLAMMLRYASLRGEDLADRLNF
jgi:integrase